MLFSNGAKAMLWICEVLLYVLQLCLLCGAFFLLKRVHSLGDAEPDIPEDNEHPED